MGTLVCWPDWASPCSEGVLSSGAWPSGLQLLSVPDLLLRAVLTMWDAGELPAPPKCFPLPQGTVPSHRLYPAEGAGSEQAESTQVSLVLEVGRQSLSHW